MLQLERNAEFLRKIRAGLDASEERAAEQELGDWKSFFRRRVCEKFGQFLGLILNARSFSWVSEFQRRKDAYEAMCCELFIRNYTGQQLSCTFLFQPTGGSLLIPVTDVLEESGYQPLPSGSQGLMQLTLYCCQPNCFGIHVD